MRVMVAPLKTGHSMEQAFRFCKNKSARFYSFTEMDQGNFTFIPLAKRVFGRGSVVFSRDIAEHSEEAPILLRTAPWVKPLKMRVTRLSQDIPGPGLGNDRWLTELWFKFFGKTYVIFSTHTNAGVQRVMGDMSIIPGDRWDVFKQQIEKIEKLVGEAIMDPSVSGVILQGDFNMMPEGDGRTDFHSPHQMFKRLHMHYKNSRVVYMGVWGMKFNKVSIFPKGTPGWPSDHGAILATLSRNTNSKKPKL